MNDRYINYGEASNLPDEAFEMTFDIDGPLEFNDQWLKTADRDDQIIALKEWFTDRYCDPAQETPYNSREGGYLYIHGGPYAPDDELNERFGDCVPQEVIDEVVNELVSDVGDEWAPIRWNREDEFDDLPLEQFGERLTPKINLDERIEKLDTFIKNSAQLNTSNQLVLHMAYSMLISYFEAYLSETVIFWAKKNDSVTFRIATKEFKDKNYKLNEIFDDIDKFKATILTHLSSNVVWHRLDKLKPTIEYGLNITLPNFGRIFGAVIERHDIVHRGGFKKDSSPLILTIHNFQTTKDDIQIFAEQMEDALKISFPIV
jgi:hypothetical protein